MSYVLAGYGLTLFFWVAYLAWSRPRDHRPGPR